MEKTQEEYDNLCDQKSSKENEKAQVEAEIASIDEQIETLQAAYDDIDEAKRNLRTIFGNEFFENLKDSKKIALIDMMFNLGMVKFLTFKRFIFAVETQNWENASYEIIHSRAYEQNKKRYKKLSEQIRN